MRKEMYDLVKNAIVFRYHLPNTQKGIVRSAFSTQKDVCFCNNDPQNISKVIYNGIIEYAKNEYKIDYSRLEKEQLKALKLSLRYNDDADDSTKQKYGFYGEILLYSILKVHMGADVLISKGYFYSPLERAEAKGYDVFHLIERNDNVELWFGESKFYENYKPAITKIIDNLSNALSDKYLERNIFAIIDEKDNCTTFPSKLKQIVNSWEDNPDIKLVDEINKHKIKLTYPIFVAYQKGTNKSYDETIKDCIDHILYEFNSKNIQLLASFDFSLFFIFLPLEKVKNIKGDVIKWITERQPLI